ncbi:glycosyltransferase family 2 protein [Calidifontibacillus erzurumensis]|uniref:Glycosyltransferase family 2 protein n=1 Tax=Calidifontibacillus erzurumensis TaxID=2741433 RepID=A0A8J8GE74_9BACI|nr:glycosyltransferase family 2 protein [Calidifontibacillus erzurumensis]NSL52037.1 glycosyltransferase family 2 protein [Calidifontibacillus erzurumensis]
MKKNINGLNNNSNKVDILLSTYNGSKYLPELLLSILNQSYQDWKIIIRDDGSNDDTISVINDFMNQYPEKVIFIQDHFQNLRPCQSFSKLLEYSSAPYIMFCDQDDIWLSDKVEITIKKMLSLEKEFPNSPLLVHTDLTVVDNDLKVISRSFWEYQKLNPKYNKLNNLLTQNIVTGCTMMINKHLKELVKNIPQKAIMHDWWIALVASLYGGINHIYKPTVLYRQHSGNNVGAKKYSIRQFFTKSKYREAFKSVKKIIEQAQQFITVYNSQLSKEQFYLIKSFIQLLEKNRLLRLVDICVYRFRKNGLIRNIGFLLIMFLFNKKK